MAKIIMDGKLTASGEVPYDEIKWHGIMEDDSKNHENNTKDQK